jgi:glycerol-3-phosphate dehydrogenase
MEKGGFEVEAGDGLYSAKFLVNAAGLFADEISAMAGAPTFKIIPRKGEEYLLDKKREHMANHIIFPLPSKTSKGILWAPTDVLVGLKIFSGVDGQSGRGHSGLP